MTASHSSSRHVEDHALAQDAGHADQAVQLAVCIDAGAHQVLGAVPVGDVAVVGDCGAALGFDLVDDVVRGPFVAALTFDGAAEVGHNDFRTLGCQ